MNTERGRALLKAVQDARAAYFETEKDYMEALNLAQDTRFQNPDTTHGVHVAAQRSALALSRYATAMKELADYLTKRATEQRR